MFFVEVEHGNGYHCNCCREIWTVVEEYETRDEVLTLIDKCKDRDYDALVISIIEGVSKSVEEFIENS